MSGNKHENYEILNLIGYGLAKFDMEFVRNFGFETKSAFYQNIVQSRIAETVGTVKNRQDLFDPFFDNDRKGWWQKGDAYIHRKVFIDSLFGEYDAKIFADLVKLYIENKFDVTDLKPTAASPIIKSKFRQLQETGREAELYFIGNYHQIEPFKNGSLEDARFFGDGYDFQIQIEAKFFLVEVKGLRSSSGNFRLTEKEFDRAIEYKNDYSLVVVSNLEDVPKITTVFNPTDHFVLKRQERKYLEVSYHSKPLKW